jgi:hypothetical protein
MKRLCPGVRRLAALLAAVVLLPGPALAQDELPGRVGRLADVAGRVYLATEQRAEDWLEVQRNDTLTSGDNLWVGSDGHAELDYGGGQVRLAGDTNVHLARLDDAILALFVAQGRIIVRLRVLEPGDAARIDTPNTQIALTRPGLYRIDVSPGRTRTELVVREGEATASFATGLQQVLPGQTAVLEGDVPALASVRNGYYVDAFDAWSAERDRRYDRARSTAYVSRQMIGYPDLDEYGRWETSGEYGALWYPSNVPGDWAPYRYGRWSWVGDWGWTWVDDAPWGYAPFHYGRWVYAGHRWGWAPGGYVARPMWSPAMVGWYGGDGWSFSVSYGAPVYGWVPLGWGEPLVPWWRGCSNRCWTMVNRPYAVNLAERPHAPPVRYTNWSAPGGVTAVPGAMFGGRRPVHPNVVDVRPNAVAAAPVLSQAPRYDKPAPGKGPGTRPVAAPLPAAALQTRPMQLPPTLVRPGTLAVPDGRPVTGSTVRPDPRGGSGPSTVPGAAAGGTPVRPSPRAPVERGTWGATGPQQPPGGGTGMAAPPAPGPTGPGATPRESRPAPGTLQRDVRPAPGASPSEPRALPPPSSAVPRPDSRPAAPPAAGLGQPSSPAPPASLQRPGVYAPAPANPAGPAAAPRGAPPAQPVPRSAPGAPVVAPQGQPTSPAVQVPAPPQAPQDANVPAAREAPAPRPSPREVPR